MNTLQCTASNGAGNTRDLYVEKDSESLLQKLELLTLFHVFIIQKKTSVDVLSGNVTHEILDNKKNIIMKATRPLSLFSKKVANKITVRNRRNAKLFSMVVEPTNDLNATGTEATVYLYPKKKIAHVEKCGGVFAPPCYEIFNIDGETAFTIDPVIKKTSNSAVVEYNISSKVGTVANIMVKSGLNFILSEKISELKILDKAALIGVIMAMDLLKNGTRREKDKEPQTNQYTFQ